MTKFNSFEQLLEHFQIEGVNVGQKRSNSLVNSNRKRVDVIFPIEPKQSRSQRCLRIIGSGSYSESLERILFESLFGDPRVFQWFVLFELLNSIKLYSKEAQALYDVTVGLTSNSTNVGSDKSFMFSNMPSIRRKFGKEKANELAEILRGKLDIPQNRDWPSDFTKVVPFTRKFKTSPEIRRIGVGYKDKGTLPLPGSEYEPEIPLLLNQHCPIKLWELFRSRSGLK